MRKKAQGCIFSSENDIFDKTTPTPTSDASTSTMNCQDGSGVFKMGAENKPALQNLKRSLGLRRPTESFLRGGEIRQRKGDLNKVPNELPVKISKPQKTLDRSATVWGGPIRNSFCLGGIHSDTFGRENKTQERNRPCMKLTLLHLGAWSTGHDHTHFGRRPGCRLGRQKQINRPCLGAHH